MAGCREIEFEKVVNVAEASGAVWVEASFEIGEHVVVVGDSGTKGAFAIVDAASGKELGRGRLPLGEGVSDDIEGMTRVGERYYALTSGGWVRQYRRTAAAAFEMEGDAYPLDAALVCASPKKTNCHMDFEGICLGAGEGCSGYAASKATGDLVCLVMAEDGRLTARPDQRIHVAPAGALTGCDVAPEGDLLYAGNNLLGKNEVVRVRGWADPATARVESLGMAGPGFGEAIAVGRAGEVFRFSDLGSAPSAMGKVSCAPAPR